MLNLTENINFLWLEVLRILKIEESSTFLNAFASACWTHVVFVEPLEEMCLMERMLTQQYFLRENSLKKIYLDRKFPFYYKNSIRKDANFRIKL